MTRLYRFLLRMLPRAFREAYGEEMAALFERQRREAGGRAGRLAYDVLAVRDLLAQSLSLRVPTGRPRPFSRWPGKRSSRLDAVGRDLRQAARSLRSAPAFTGLAVLILGSGIGATTAVYGVVRAVLLRPLPYPEPERLVRVFDTAPTVPEFALTPANFLDERESQTAFDAFAVYVRGDAEISLGDAPERVSGMLVSSGFFRVVGIPPMLGRGFTRAEELPANRYVVVVSERFWRERLGGDPAVLGGKIVVDGVPHTVVGVAPDRLKHVGGRFRSLPYGVRVDVFRPFAFGPDPNRYQHYLNAVARLATGVSVSGAEAEMNAIAERLEREYPEVNRGWRIALMPLREEIVRDSRATLWALFGAVAMLLAIACVNVASLLLVRGAGREHELAVRSALGADRRRLVTQMLTESLLLSFLGGTFGLSLAWAALRSLPALGGTGLPRLDEALLDPGVTGFALLATAATGVAFGVLPALRLPRAWTSLGRSRSGETAKRKRLRGAFVVAQIALAIVLLVSAGLLSRTFLRLSETEPGFRAAGVLTAKVSLPSARYPEGRDEARLFAQLVERFQNVPGVAAAGAGSSVPWSGYDENFGFEPEGRPGQRFGARFHFATPGYFRALGVPTLGGRTFAPSDDAEAPRRVVVNARLARDVWGQGDPVGRRISFTSEPTEADWWTVIGVVGDVKDGPGADAAKPAVYMPFSQQQWTRELAVVVKTESDPAAVLTSLRAALAELDKDLPLSEVRMLEDVSAGAFDTPRLLSRLTAAFALVALGLAVVGLYGVVAFNVSQETRTTAIRIAIGARSKDLFRDVLRKSLRLVAAGAVLGTAGALVAGRALESLLHGVSPYDPVTLSSAALLLASAALLASLLPARRACRVDPIEALRAE